MRFKFILCAHLHMDLVVKPIIVCRYINIYFLATKVPKVRKVTFFQGTFEYT